MELSKQLSHRDYLTLLNQRDPNRHPIQKIRRCFHWHGHYFQLDMFKTPSKHQDLLLLETYTTKNGEELKLPVFLEIVKEVTDDSGYSMYNLSVICKQ
jgi:CYTH domain-containing protein